MRLLRTWTESNRSSGIAEGNVNDAHSIIHHPSSIILVAPKGPNLIPADRCSQWRLGSVVLTAVLLLCTTAIQADEMTDGNELLEKGVQAVQAQQWDEAEKLFQQVVAQDSSLSAMAQNDLGYLYDQQKRYDQAISAYNEALRLTKEPTLVKQIHYNLAQVYLHADQPPEQQKPHWQKKAIEHLQFVLEREPENPKLHLELGMAYFSTANPGGGIEEFGKASQLAKEPQWVWIHEKIRDYYLQIHLLERADQEEAIIRKMKGEESAS